MSGKFDIKDYFNYSISGLLWILLLLLFLISTSILSVETLFNFNHLNNSGLLISLMLVFGSYIVGNLLRFTEKILQLITNVLYGNQYYTALVTDRNKCLDQKPKEKISKLGILYLIFQKKPLSIGEQSSIEIEKNLKNLKIFSNKKKNQYLMSETYLIINFSNLRYERLKNLKNLYESISLPIIISLLWATQFIFTTILIWYLKYFLIAAIILVLYKFIDRYRYLRSNYVKDIYRYFLFIESKN